MTSTRYIGANIPTVVHEAIGKIAAAERRTRSNVIAVLLEEAINARRGNDSYQRLAEIVRDIIDKEKPGA